MSANSNIDPYNMHVGTRICIPPQRPDLQNPNGQRPNRPNAPGGPQSGSSRPPQSGTPGGQRPVPSHPSRPGTNGGQQPGSSRPSRPGTSGNQQSGGMQIMPRTEVSAGTASSDTQSSAASASGSASDAKRLRSSGGSGTDRYGTVIGRRGTGFYRFSGYGRSQYGEQKRPGHQTFRRRFPL